MASFKLTLAYDGTAYAGWQRQSNALAVQQVAETAFERLLGESVTLVGSSRTDAGVHARGQVAHLRLGRPFPARGLVHGANHHLPPDVRVLAAEPVAETFHARYDAIAKLYSYRIVRVHVPSPLDRLYAVAVETDLDLGAMRAATAALPGRHDFSAFALAGGSHRQAARTVLGAEWEERGPELIFRVQGDGFLRGMVRGLVGTLLEVGRGRRSPEGFAALLAGRPRSEAGPTAPAHGLCLEWVRYAAAAASQSAAATVLP